MQQLLLLLLLCVSMAPHYSLRLAFPAQPAMADSRVKSPLSAPELSINEAERGSTEQHERRSERATEAAASTGGTAPLVSSSSASSSTSSPRLPKDRRAGRRRGVLSERRPILRPRSQAPTECLGGLLDGLHATGRKKGSSWYSAKAFSTAAAAILVLFIALQGLQGMQGMQSTVSAPKTVGDALQPQYSGPAVCCHGWFVVCTELTRIFRGNSRVQLLRICTCSATYILC